MMPAYDLKQFELTAATAAEMKRQREELQKILENKRARAERKWRLEVRRNVLTALTEMKP